MVYTRVKNMDTKRLGNIGEALTQAEFVMRGIPLYLPFGENENLT